MDQKPENEQQKQESNRENFNPSIHGTVEFLVRRMRHKGDLPTFSRHIIEINNKLASLTAINLSSTGELANIILKDFSLTNKLLRVVNSAFYGNLSGRVTTVSKAVFLLGFEKVRMIAATLMIFEHLQNKAEFAELEEATIASYMSGIMAMNLAEQMRLDRKEEAFICGMLFNLGRILVICYFPEEYREIRKRLLEITVSEDQAVRSVIGITYKELGMAISKSWNFPEKIVDSMEGLPPEEVKKPKTEKEVLQHLANYSNELCELVANAREGELLSGFNDLAKRYQNSISVSAGDAVSLISSVTSKVENYSEFVRINPQKSSLMRNMMQLHRPDQSAKSESASPKSPGPKSGTTVEPSSTQPTKAQTEEQTQTLRNGIREIADVMKGNYALGDIIYMIMETMYRGFLFDRVVFAMRDKTHTQMTARFGLGNEIENIIPKFHFSIGSSNDIFNIAIAKAKGIVIDDAESPNIIKSLPQWYRSSITTSSFLIYPITVKYLCIGVIYADRQKRGVLLTESQMQQMEELRQMAVNAIEQKRPGES